MSGVAKPILRYTAILALDALIVGIFFRYFHVNPTTVGFSFLLAVLVVSATWGLRYAVVMAVVATLCYNYFFLPPVFQFTIADPQNWVALGAFLATALIASQLAERARREAMQSHQRRQELERLYAFSQQLLVTGDVLGLLNNVPGYIVENFDAKGAVIFLDEKQKTYFSDISIQSQLPLDELRLLSGRGEPGRDRERGLCFTPVRMGMRSLGLVAILGCSLSPETLEAIGGLVAIAIERAGAMEQLSRAEAARQSERLRSLLLDSVTHEFRTPLTSIKASAETLLSEVELDKPQMKELAAVIDEEADRLNRLVGEAAEVAQLDSHQVELHIEPQPIREAVDLALERAKHALEQHPVDLNVPDSLPPVPMDRERIAEVLGQLLENAGKYSPPGTTVHITAEVQNGKIVTSVADHGPGIEDFEQSMIFEKFYRGRNQRLSIQGTGMGLAIAKAIVELHGGSIGLTTQVGRGSVFYFSLPLAS